MGRSEDRQRLLMEPDSGAAPKEVLAGADLRPLPRLEVVRSTRGFARLFDGTTRARIVSYVAHATDLLDLFDGQGIGHVDLILGESIEQFRSSLDLARLDRIVGRLEDGSLALYVPRKTIHSKLYLLDRPGGLRVLHGSRNLYPSGSWDSVAVYDLPAGHPLGAAFVQHFEEHRHGCEPYLGDLAGQVGREPARRRELLEAWVQRAAPADAVTGPAPLLREATQRALLDPSAELLTIALPDAPVAQKSLEGYLAELRPSVRGGELVVPMPEYLRLVERRVRYPLLGVDPRAREVRLILGGTARPRSAPLPADRGTVGRALHHLERYVEMATEEVASPWDLDVHIAATTEALLYFLAAPFFHEHMKQRRARVGLVDRRGPPFLVIYGRSSNGKSTFLQFALKLLAGEAVAPLPGREFKESTLERVRAHGTVFPLVFDDIPSVTDRKFEEVVKTYWEKRWQEEAPVPALVFSTNLPTLRDWARTRVKRVVFPVYFHARPERKEALHQLLLEENPIFPWFAHRYLERLAGRPALSADDLALARSVMLELYAYAGRAPPAWFPREPFEARFDVGRLDWHDLVHSLRKAAVHSEGSRVRVEFTPDLQPSEVAHYESLLPLDLNKDRRGHTLLIYAPERFLRWLDAPRPAPDSPSGSVPGAPPAAGRRWAERIRRTFTRVRRPPGDRA